MRILHIQPHDQTTPDTPRTVLADHITSWTAFIGGPALWFLQFLVNSALVQLDGKSGRWPLLLCNAVFLALAAACGVFAFFLWRRKDPPYAANYQRARFMAQVGALTSALFFLLILAQGIPILVFDPSET